jgi:hypothetical protein
VIYWWIFDPGETTVTTDDSQKPEDLKDDESLETEEEAVDSDAAPEEGESVGAETDASAEAEREESDDMPDSDPGEAEESDKEDESAESEESDSEEGDETGDEEEVASEDAGDEEPGTEESGEEVFEGDEPEDSESDESEETSVEAEEISEPEISVGETATPAAKAVTPAFLLWWQKLGKNQRLALAGGAVFVVVALGVFFLNSMKPATMPEHMRTGVTRPGVDEYERSEHAKSSKGEAVDLSDLDEDGNPVNTETLEGMEGREGLATADGTQTGAVGGVAGANLKRAGQSPQTGSAVAPGSGVATGRVGDVGTAERIGSRANLRESGVVPDAAGTVREKRYAKDPNLVLKDGLEGMRTKKVIAKPNAKKLKLVRGGLKKIAEREQEKRLAQIDKDLEGDAVADDFDEIEDIPEEKDGDELEEAGIESEAVAQLIPELKTKEVRIARANRRKKTTTPRMGDRPDPLRVTIIKESPKTITHLEDAWLDSLELAIKACVNRWPDRKFDFSCVMVREKRKRKFDFLDPQKSPLSEIMIRCMERGMSERPAPATALQKTWRLNIRAKNE